MGAEVAWHGAGRTPATHNFDFDSAAKCSFHQRFNGSNMSDKIKSKDLKYDSSLPPFLQRLHDQRGGGGDPDRHERAIARPRKPKDANEDDGPTVVDDNGETLSKEQYEHITNDPAALDSDTAHVTGKVDPATEPMAHGALPDTNAELETRKTDNNLTNGTAQKKRKAAKVVGDEDAAEKDPDQESTATKTAKKAKKKAKVKLAFDDDEAENS